MNEPCCRALNQQRIKYGVLVYVFPGGKGGPYRRSIWDLPIPRGLNWWQKKSIRKLQNHIPTLKNLPRGRTGRGWHALRHTFATRVIKADIDIVTLKDWLGHRKIETTMRYIHVARHYDKRIELI